MPLTPKDREFLEAVERLKTYLVLMAGGVFAVLLFTPARELHAVTSLVGLVLCALFWVTQRLLSFIAILDLELNRLRDAVLRSMPEAQRREFLRQK